MLYFILGFITCWFLLGLFALISDNTDNSICLDDGIFSYLLTALVFIPYKIIITIKIKKDRKEKGE